MGAFVLLGGVAVFLRILFAPGDPADPSTDYDSLASLFVPSASGL